MKCFILAGCLSTFLAGSVAQSVAQRPASVTPQSVATGPSASSSTEQQRDVFYMSDRFGFRFISPSGYVITPSEAEPATQPAPPLQVLELWSQADFLNRVTLPEVPPIIQITVYHNPQQLPLAHWKGELSRPDDRPLTIAGQSAIAYTSTGLYEYDHVLLNSPDGQHVFRLTVGYIDAQAPIRQVFQDLVTSFTFDVTANPQSATNRPINYSRLQRLLAAQNWQAADLETRAILQRLAGPQGDLLFSSQSVLARIPLADLKTLDTLWSQASGGRFGFSAQHRIWQQVINQTKNPQAQVEQFAKQVKWHRDSPLAEQNPIGIELSGTWWRLDSELDYTTAAPVGHLPWVGVSSSRLIDLLNERSLGCGSCTIDAIYLVGDRYSDYLPAFFARFGEIKK